MDRLNQHDAAKLLIDQHGSGAQAHAMRQVLDRRAAGDGPGEWHWMSVFDAVLKLEAYGSERSRPS